MKNTFYFYLKPNELFGQPNTIESSPSDHHTFSVVLPKDLPYTLLCTFSLPTKSIFHITG